MNNAMQFLMMILIFLFLQHHFNFINGRISLSEHEALLGIKSAITHDPYNCLSSWNSTTHHCTWPRVICFSESASNRHVISLDITSCFLNGTLSPDIGFLKNLRNLSVANNNLSGPLPSSLFLLSGLQHLDLSTNEFNGSLSSSLSSLKALQYLDLSGNKFNCPLPLDVAEMVQLRCLSLGFNNFSGEIPPEIGKLQFLEELVLEWNALSGALPSELGYLTSLNLLCLSMNQLSGEIPESFSQLNNLTDLYLADNNLSGSMPRNLGTNGKLEYLDLSQNKLTGNLPGVELIDLSNNELSGALPPTIGNFSSLQELFLQGNRFSGSIHPQIGNLQYLDLSSNNFSGKIPNLLPNLVFLNLSRNQLSGDIPEFPAYLPLYELLSMNQACKPFRDAITNDVLIWLDIIVERRLSLCLTDESLIKIASKANGRLQNLALLSCVRITDGGLMRVVNENPHISKLYVPRCTSLTPEGVIRAVTTLTEGSNCLTSVKINGIYNLNQHLQALESNLPKGQDREPRFYHKYDNYSFRSLDKDTRPIDVEMCPKCQMVRLVFDCGRKSCGDRCRGCLHCFSRCAGCGRCITDADDELEKTICLDYLCLDCWLSLLKCNHCTRPFCPRHADEETS
ncbi:hypothetical protein Cgig2_031753 [Carnegiea gigantea]|uniref:Uncharacterized protein n=1 Tax=Carnegiea gigantea TaxID=171969 RepID=A0A9Q1KRP3_9CARY|nr:hypothetical protein Cgig2_031753 [Carnegiea gigantea]